MRSLSPRCTRATILLAFLCFSLLLVSCGGGDSSSTTVGPVAKITISPASANIQAGQTQSFFPVPQDASGNSVTNVTLTWTSSAPAVATVDANGLATGVAPGTTQITTSATPSSSTTVTSNSATLNVTTRVTSVVISPMSTTVAVNGTRQFTATALDAQGNPVTNATFSWFCSFSGVATVDNNGLATGISPGTVTIVATTGALSSQPATLTVTP